MLNFETIQACSGACFLRRRSFTPLALLSCLLSLLAAPALAALPASCHLNAYAPSDAAQVTFKVYCSGVLIFLGYGTAVQLTVCIVSLIVYLFLLSTLQPFRSGYDNMLWTAGLCKLLLTTWPVRRPRLREPAIRRFCPRSSAPRATCLDPPHLQAWATAGAREG